MVALPSLLLATGVPWQILLFLSWLGMSTDSFSGLVQVTELIHLFSGAFLTLEPCSTDDLILMGNGLDSAMTIFHSHF